MQVIRNIILLVGVVLGSQTSFGEDMDYQDLSPLPPIYSTELVSRFCTLIKVGQPFQTSLKYMSPSLKYDLIRVDILGCAAKPIADLDYLFDATCSHDSRTRLYNCHFYINPDGETFEERSLVNTGKEDPRAWPCQSVTNVTFRKVLDNGSTTSRQFHFLVGPGCVKDRLSSFLESERLKECSIFSCSFQLLSLDYEWNRIGVVQTQIETIDMLY